VREVHLFSVVRNHSAGHPGFHAHDPPASFVREHGARVVAATRTDPNVLPSTFARLDDFIRSDRRHVLDEEREPHVLTGNVISQMDVEDEKRRRADFGDSPDPARTSYPTCRH